MPIQTTTKRLKDMESFNGAERTSSFGLSAEIFERPESDEVYEPERRRGVLSDGYDAVVITMADISIRGRAGDGEWFM